MAKHSITAVFDTRSHAEQAVAQLTSSGVPSSDITLLPDSADATSSTMASDEKGKGFWGSLEQLFGGTEDHATYAESIRRGGIMVSVRAEDSEMDRIIDILEQHGSVDLDEREATWRSEGWTGSSATTDRSGLGIGSAGMTGMATDAGSSRATTGTIGAGALGAGVLGAGATGATAYEERRDAVVTQPATIMDRTVADRTATTASTGLVGKMRDAADDVIQIVEERLDVGKRTVNRGKVRVHTSVVSREVSEDVTLRGETVTIDRRTVDKPVSAAAFDVDPFKERTIEMEQFDEEAVVAKSAHVVEEIGIRKDATDRVETVRDTLRETKVDIDDGRTGAIVQGTASRFVDEIRDDMEVVGSDGVHVGTVDHMESGRIKLKKIDPAAGGEHHYLSPDMVRSVAGKVMLAMTAAEAKAAWTAA